jgi:hypothetical protein
MIGIRRALLVSTADKYFSLAVNIGALAVISRLLSPAEIGVSVIGTAIVTFALALREFGSSGFLIQQRDLTRSDARTLFTVQFLLTVLIATGLVLAAAPAAAQQQPQQQQPRPAPTAAPSDNYVDHKDFKAVVFTVRHRDPETLLPVLRLLTSGHKGAGVTSDRTFRAITVRDFPENVASIEEAIKRLDTPEGERPTVELRMHALLASNSAPAPGAEQPPADLRDVLTQLKSTLNFKNYEVLTSVVQRTRESRGREPGYITGDGTGEMLNAGGEKKGFNYSFTADSLSFTPAASGAASVQLGNFNFAIRSAEIGQARIRSDVSLREGERVVVGTAGVGNRALILVLTARTVK